MAAVGVQFGRQPLNVPMSGQVAWYHSAAVIAWGSPLTAAFGALPNYVSVSRIACAFPRKWTSITDVAVTSAACCGTNGPAAEVMGNAYVVWRWMSRVDKQ